MTTPTSQAQPTAAASTWNTPSLVIGGLGLVAIGALGAVLLLGNRNPAPDAPSAPVAVVAPAPAPESASAPVLLAATAPDEVPAAAAPVATAKPPPAPKAPTPPAPKAAPAAAHKTAHAPKPADKPAATDTTATIPTESTTTEPVPGTRSEAAAPAVEAPPKPKPVCTTCGVVTSVTPLKQEGEAGALGTVAGGVLGGVLGHQVGGGSGKDAMTVIGAIGGALAGREVEKRQRATTAYEIRIRMDDGSQRSFTRDQAYVVGQKVRVEGDKLSLRSSGSSDNGY